MKLRGHEIAVNVDVHVQLKSKIDVYFEILFLYSISKILKFYKKNSYKIYSLRKKVNNEKWRLIDFYRINALFFYQKMT